MSALTAEERDVVADYAKGLDVRDIAEARGLRPDRVQGILSIKAGLSRNRARELTDAAESPLTAPIKAANGKAAAAKKAPTPPPPEPPRAATWRPAEPGDTPGQLAPGEADTPAPVANEPEPLTAERILDVGIEDFAARLRTLVASLATVVARNQRADEVARRVADLERQLAHARAELDGGDT